MRIRHEVEEKVLQALIQRSEEPKATITAEAGERAMEYIRHNAGSAMQAYEESAQEMATFKKEMVAQDKSLDGQIKYDKLTDEQKTRYNQLVKEIEDAKRLIKDKLPEVN